MARLKLVVQVVAALLYTVFPCAANTSTYHIIKASVTSTNTIGSDRTTFASTVVRSASGDDEVATPNPTTLLTTSAALDTSVSNNSDHYQDTLTIIFGTLGTVATVGSIVVAVYSVRSKSRRRARRQARQRLLYFEMA